MDRISTHRDLVARPVADIMSHPVLSVLSSELLDNILTTMVRTGLRHLAIVDDMGQCRGVVADRAVAAAWATNPSALACTSVDRFLDQRPSIVGGDATVGDVARAMHTDGVDAVAVIDRTGRPIGMVTGGDLVALMATTQPRPPKDTEPSDDATSAPDARDLRPTA